MHFLNFAPKVLQIDAWTSIYSATSVNLYLSCFICLTNWFTFFHRHLPANDKFPRFDRHRTHKYQTLVFGLSLAPWVLQEALRNVSFRVSAYLDNLLLCTPSQNEEGTRRFLQNVPQSVGPNGLDMGCYSPGVFAKPGFGWQQNICVPTLTSTGS